MATPEEPDFPRGHPKRFDYDPESPEAIEWARIHIHPAGERDFPVGHPKALDTEGNTNAVPVLPGVDPNHPELEAFTGRTPRQVAAERALWEQRVAESQPTKDPEPTIAPPPPKRPGILAEPTGQPESVVTQFLREHGLRGL
jgi:hypothetical protein